MNKLIDDLDIALENSSKYFLRMLLISHVVYIFAYIGVFSISSKYINNLDIIAQLFICAFLILRFHPFRKHTLKENDVNVIFACATLLLLNLGIVQLLTPFLKSHLVNIKNKLQI